MCKNKKNDNKIILVLLVLVVFIAMTTTSCMETIKLVEITQDSLVSSSTVYNYHIYHLGGSL